MKNLLKLVSLIIIGGCSGQTNIDSTKNTLHLVISDTTELTIMHAIRFFDDSATIVEIEKLGYKKSKWNNQWSLDDSLATDIAISAPALNKVFGMIKDKQTFDDFLKELKSMTKVSKVKTDEDIIFTGYIEDKEVALWYCWWHGFKFGFFSVGKHEFRK